MTRRNFFKALAGVGAVFLGSAAVGMTSPAGQKVPKQIIHIRGESPPPGYPLVRDQELARSGVQKIAEMYRANPDVGRYPPIVFHDFATPYWI